MINYLVDLTVENIYALNLCNLIEIEIDANIYDQLDRSGLGGNPYWFLELVGGQAMLYSMTPPDPMTARSPYYYNTRENNLYKKVSTSCGGESSKYWKLVTEY